MACGHNFKTKTWKSNHIMLSKLSGDHRLLSGKKAGEDLWFSLTKKKKNPDDSTLLLDSRHVCLGVET